MRKILPLAIAALATFANAQCFDSNYGTSLGVGPDVVFGIQPIGFAFPLAGTTYTNIHVTDKGYVYLSNAGVPAPGLADFSATAAELASGSPRICALWSDIQATAGNSAQVYLNSTPSECTITWQNVQCFNGTSGLFDLQMKLFPSGEVLFSYGAGATNNSTQAAWQVGIVGISPGGATLPTGNDLSTPGNSTDNLLFEEFTLPNTFDMAGNGLRLIPTNPGWVWLPPANCAVSTTYGIGCGGAFDRFHEFFNTGAFDLAGTTISMLRSGSGYLVLNQVPGVYVPPSPTATIVANADDIEQSVTLSSPMPVAGGVTSSLNICSNGRIALGAAGNGVDWTPTVAEFQAFANATISPAWHDYNPTLSGSGKIYFEEAGGFAYVTWDAVYTFGTTLPDTFQVQFNLATGDITIVYVSSTVGGAAYLAGYKVSGTGGQTLSGDLTTLLTNGLTIGDVGQPRLALGTTGAPRIGTNNFTFVISNIPPVLPAGVLFFGDQAINPGVDLTFLGMPGCNAYSNANLLSVTLPAVGGVSSVALPIANNPALLGISMTTQALAFSLATPANLITSNGNQFTVGQ